MISVIIPSYNDADRLLKLIPALNQIMSEVDPDYELIVVYDGTTDDSFQRMTRLKESIPNLRNIFYPTNAGKGASLAVGFAHATGDYVGFLNADNSVSLANWREMVKCITASTGNDCVIASRYKKGGRVKQPILRRIASRCFNVLANLMFKLDVDDVRCGAKIFTRPAIETILKNTTLEGFSCDLEYLYTLRRNNYRIYEHPVNWEEMDSYSSILTILFLGTALLKDMIALKRGNSTGFTWKDIYYRR